MPAKWQKFTVEVPKDFGPAEREFLGQEILDFIRERVRTKNLDKDNKKLPAYSESYAKSLEFKIAGKSKNEVNLTLSGDMLDSMDLLNHRAGKLTLGFENGTIENAKADGNIRGTYGKSKPVAPPRDFLGLTQSDLEAIIEKVRGDKLGTQSNSLAQDALGIDTGGD